MLPAWPTANGTMAGIQEWKLFAEILGQFSVAIHTKTNFNFCRHEVKEGSSKSRKWCKTVFSIGSANERNHGWEHCPAFWMYCWSPFQSSVSEPFFVLQMNTFPILHFNRPFPIPRFLAEERTSPSPSDPCCSGWWCFSFPSTRRVLSSEVEVHWWAVCSASQWRCARGIKPHAGRCYAKGVGNGYQGRQFS